MEETAVGDPKIRGRVKFLKENFGFLENLDQSTERDSFFHSSALVNIDYAALKIGDLLEYSISLSSEDDKNYKAREIRIVRKPFGAFSLKGPAHYVNEDDFLVYDLIPGERIFAAVADGLSNPPDTGAWASSEALTLLSKEIEASPFKDKGTALHLEKNKITFRKIIDTVQQEFKLLQKKMTDAKRRGKTTLIFVVCDKENYIAASAGDSFILKIDLSGKNYPNYIIGNREGRIKSSVLSPIGDRDASWKPEVVSGKILANEGLLLCSDGIMLNSIQRFITANLSSQDIAKKLVEYSIQEGGSDDATCTLISL